MIALSISIIVLLIVAIWSVYRRTSSKKESFVSDNAKKPILTIEEETNRLVGPSNRASLHSPTTGPPVGYKLYEGKDPLSSNSRVGGKGAARAINPTTMVNVNKLDLYLLPRALEKKTVLPSEGKQYIIDHAIKGPRPQETAHTLSMI